MIIFSPRLKNYQFSQPRYIFLIYGNTMYIIYSLYSSSIPTDLACCGRKIHKHRIKPFPKQALVFTCLQDKS